MALREVFKKTTDLWYGNYGDNRDEVKLMYLGEIDDDCFRVACWGNDDFGIERDFETEEEVVRRAGFQSFQS